MNLRWVEDMCRHEKCLRFWRKISLRRISVFKKINKYEFSIFIKRINFQHLKKFFFINKKDVLYPDNIDGKKLY